jgi:hypothetical protein
MWPYGKRSSVSLTPPGYSRSSPGLWYDVAFSKPTPTSSSPKGIRIDSPLQRTWIPALDRQQAPEGGDGLRRRLVLEPRDEAELPDLIRSTGRP